jgi:transposase
MNEKSLFGRRCDQEFKANAVTPVRGGSKLTAPWPAIRAFPPGLWDAGRRRPMALTPRANRRFWQRKRPSSGNLRRLRQENDGLRRQQRDILRKALGLLSAEMPPHVMR